MDVTAQGRTPLSFSLAQSMLLLYSNLCKFRSIFRKIQDSSVDIQIRPYQQQALDTLTALARKKQFLLLQAATGAGKTVIASCLMQYYTRNWGFRCLFLAHKAILVRQALSRMQASFADADFDVDCLCASVRKPGQMDSLIIVASPQTLARRLDDLPKIDVVIIDECHRVPPKNHSSLYSDVIQAVITRRPNARVIGITATPWRLGQSFIYGPAVSEESDTWWDDLDVHISIASLQAQGWLAPLSALVCEPEEDLVSLPVGPSGDFREDALEAALLRPLHLGSAVKAVQIHAEGRRHIAAFCVTIAHARALASRFCEAGITASAIDSKAGQQANLQTLEAFARGDIRVLCSVGMLTEGWDCPQTDCLLMCRPTLSPALYVQMVGRGLRIAEGKKDCLLLDLSGNILRHGSPNAPRIRTGKDALADVVALTCAHRKEGEDEHHCPYCEAVLPESAGLHCPFCQGPFYELEEKSKSFRSIDLAQLEKYTRQGEAVRRKREEAEARKRAEEKARKEAQAKARAAKKAALVNGGQQVTAEVVTCSTPVSWQVRNGPAQGVMVLKFDLLLQVAGYGRRTVQVILDPEGAMGRRSRTSWWVHTQTKEFWNRCGKGAFPATRASMVARWPGVTIPSRLQVRQSISGYFQVLWNAVPAPDRHDTAESTS